MVDAPAHPELPDLTRLLQAVEASGEIIFMTDREGVFTFVNAQFERLYGYAADEVVGRTTPRVLKGGATASAQYDEFWQRLSRGETVEDEFVNRRKDGSSLRVQATVNPIRDNADAIVGFLAIQRDITERKDAEIALRLERDRAQRYLDVADVILLGLDFEGRITLINRKGCSVLEWEEQELLGRKWIETCLPAGTRDDLTQKFHDLVGGDLSPIENPVLTKSGRERMIAWRNVVVTDAAGCAVGTLSSGDDITERKRMEQALRSSQAHLQLISDNVLDLVSQIRPDGTFLYVSPSYQTVLGYPPGQLLGTSAHSLIHPDDVELVQDILTETMKRRTTGRAEFRYRHADGRYLWVEAVGKVLLDRTGMPSGLVVCGRDITEHKRNEQALLENEQRLRIAVSSVDMSVFTQDCDLRFTWMHNPQLGNTVEEVVGKTDVELLPPELAEQIIYMKRQAIETGERMRTEVRLEDKGQKRVFELLVEPHRNAVGKIDGLSGALLDITKRRELEEQLRQSQKLEAVGSLAGGIAHDFNNLLTVVQGYAELAASDLDPASPVQQDIAEIQRAAESAASLTRQLLIFSRKGIVQPVSLRLNDIVERLEKILRRVVGEDIEVDVTLGPSLGLVKADTGQLEQVLMNLVVNARDAMPSGGSLTIATDRVEVDESFARSHGGSAGGALDRLTVIDSGSGMTPEVQAQIFNPFFTTKGPEKGTGLGLATVHGIVQQAGGFITVRSAVGQGSAFAIHLPLVTGQSDAVDADLPTEIPTGGETILFVEDNESIRMLGVRSLGRCGYTVLAARHAAEAMTIAAAHGRIDLLVTDLVMPGVNGRILAEHLRQTHEGLRVLYASGYTSDSVALSDIRTSGMDFLPKPYTPETLCRAVRVVLDRADHIVR